MKKKSIIPPELHSDRARIFALSLSHFMVDLLGCTLAGILPAVLTRFQMNLGLGVILCSAVGIGSNLLQLPASLLGRHSRSPIYLAAGVLLAGSVILLPFLPATTKLWQLALLMFIVGAGIALVHPTGLRGTQNLHTISLKLTTPIFMTLGFLGAAVGPWLASVLVEKNGMQGMIWLCIPVLFSLIAIFAAHVKMRRDPPETPDNKPNALSIDEKAPWTFRDLMIIAFLLNLGTTIINNLLPTLLNTHGFALWFGGFSNMLYGIGSATGSILLGFLARKYAPAPLILTGLLIGLPVGTLYLTLAPTASAACILAPFSGFLLCSCFPILVAMTPSAPGKYSISTRLALIVGGTWGAAGLVLPLIGQLAMRFGLISAMYAAIFFYAAALVSAILFRRKKSDFL